MSLSSQIQSDLIRELKYYSSTNLPPKTLVSYAGVDYECYELIFDLPSTDNLIGIELRAEFLYVVGTIDVIFDFIDKTNTAHTVGTGQLVIDTFYDNDSTPTLWIGPQVNESFTTAMANFSGSTNIASPVPVSGSPAFKTMPILEKMKATILFPKRVTGGNPPNNLRYVRTYAGNYFTTEVGATVRNSSLPVSIDQTAGPLEVSVAGANMRLNNLLLDPGLYSDQVGIGAGTYPPGTWISDMWFVSSAYAQSTTISYAVPYKKTITGQISTYIFNNLLIGDNVTIQLSDQVNNATVTLGGNTVVIPPGESRTFTIQTGTSYPYKLSIEGTNLSFDQVGVVWGDTFTSFDRTYRDTWFYTQQIKPFIERVENEGPNTGLFLPGVVSSDYGTAGRGEFFLQYEVQKKTAFTSPPSFSFSFLNGSAFNDFTVKTADTLMTASISAFSFSQASQRGVILQADFNVITGSAPLRTPVWLTNTAIRPEILVDARPAIT